MIPSGRCIPQRSRRRLRRLAARHEPRHHLDHDRERRLLSLVALSYLLKLLDELRRARHHVHHRRIQARESTEHQRRIRPVLAQLGLQQRELEHGPLRGVPE